MADVYTYGKSNVVKHCYDVWICKSDATAGTIAFGGTIAARTNFNVADVDISGHFVKIGAIGANPTLKTAEGDTIALGDCTDKVLSETVEFNCEVLEVTSDNWIELRTVHNEEVDVVFAEDIDAAADVDADAVCATLVRLSVQLEITGNGENKIILTGKVESGLATSRIGFLSATHEAVA